MCGRFTLRQPAKAVAEFFGLLDAPALEPRYNIAPTQQIAAIRVAPHLAQGEMEGDPRPPTPSLVKQGKEGWHLALLRWGLVPSWADDPSSGNRMINARSETVAVKPAFRSAFRRRRCLIPADGFFEWQKTETGKQPYLIGVRDGQLFAFAGLWEQWQRDGKSLESCTILTTEANPLMRPLHDRMPVILQPADYKRWLDPKVQDPAQLQPLLRPYPETEMFAHPDTEGFTRRKQ